MPFELPKLPYGYDALEPVIDAQTMELHHSKHHQTYVDKLNTALSKHPEWQEHQVNDLLTQLQSLPEEIRTAVRNHGGGHANHSLFWEIMSPVGEGGEPSEELASAIDDAFGSLDNLKQQFSDLATNHFGSGWAWLVKDSTGKLVTYSKPNQDSPLTDGQTPILTLDIWEHAYYLKYQNRRKEYVEAWWQLVNWNKVSELFKSN
jgi:superoxide dismutase, Fe-Mn family